MSHSGEALVIAGHGSHLHPDSSTPTFTHAARIREQDEFDEVSVAFWKEEPSFSQVLNTIRSELVYLVPLFMSSGYFTNQIIPREITLAGDQNTTVRFAEPVGTHEAMTSVIMERARTITGTESGAGYGLAIVGHGTERHDTSSRSTYWHAERIRERAQFEEVHACFLDEEPTVDTIPTLFDSESVVIVPLFVADGYHTTEDIPAALGLDHTSPGPTNGEPVEGHRLWYAGAVGTEPLMANLVLERAQEAGAAIRAPRMG